MNPAYEYRGWIGPWKNCWRWSVPVSDTATLVNLWQIAAQMEERGGYTPDERIKVRPAVSEDA